jgi:hypothetical protein
MLVAAQPAEAKIIYTKANERVFGIAVPLDLNHDGKTDFYFMSGVVATTPATSIGLSIHPDSPGNAVWVTGKGKAAALRAGARVGPKALFSSHNSDVSMGKIVIVQTNGKRYYYGPWENGGKGVKSRYLGLRFQIKGKTHYGWARLNFPSPQQAKLTGYAYETIPDKPILAGETKGTDESNVEQPDAVLTSPIPDIPQPAILGALALGAPGLSIWRREDSAAATPELN